jgi:nitrite reductase (NADH) small subunit
MPPLANQQSEAWIEVGKLDDIPPLGSRVVRTAHGDIAVFRAADDAVFALRDHCPHRGGPLSQGIVYGRTVACPLHNWCIDLNNGQALAPDEGCTPYYPVRIEREVIYLLLRPIFTQAWVRDD